MKIVDFLKLTAGGKLSIEEQKDFLIQNPFGSSGELAEAVEYLYSQMSNCPKLEDAIDVCGTGGSGLDRINTSTISAFLLASLNIPVAKHGNNASSGKFGSFDLLSALDVPLVLSAEELQLRYRQYNLAFLYAKNFHPIMRHFATVRSQISHPTFFNILGPLLSPVMAEKQVIGVSKKEYAILIAETAKAINKKRVIVVNGSDGLDDVTLRGLTNIVELKDGVITEYSIKPEDFGVKPVSSFSEISSGTIEENIKIAKEILQGKSTTRHKDLVLVNTAIAMYLDDEKIELKDAFKTAESKLATGAAYKILENYRRPTVLNNIVQKTKERNFDISTVVNKISRKYEGGLIAEIKRKSPSEGILNVKKDILEQAKTYEKSGVSAISVLTEPDFFGGSFDDLSNISKSVDIPILCKDFILSEKHIDKAKSAGADMILLIAAILDIEELERLYQYATKNDLQTLIEVHSKAEMEKALSIKSRFIGINSRDLHDFSQNKKIFDELKSLVPKDTKLIAESGINFRKDIPIDADGILVGSVLMKHPFPRLKLKELTGKPVLKLCGIRSAVDAELCEQLKIDLVGINFVPRSKRKVDLATAKSITAKLSGTISVGVFEDQPFEEIEKIVKEVGLDAIQLSGNEKELSQFTAPIIKTIRPGQDMPVEAFLTILDNNIAGTGKRLDDSLIEQNQPSLIAGGVNLQVAENLLKKKRPLGIDTASGIETDGVVDRQKIIEFSELFKNFTKNKI